MPVRPIGSEFEYCFPPSQTSTDVAFTIWRYRVSGHTQVDAGGGLRMAETLTPISSRRFVSERYARFFGEWRPVPPPECAALLDAGWQALAERFP